MMQDDGTWLPDEQAVFEKYLASLDSGLNEMPSFEPLRSLLPTKTVEDMQQKYSLLMFDINRLEATAHQIHMARLAYASSMSQMPTSSLLSVPSGAGTGMPAMPLNVNVGGPMTMLQQPSSSSSSSAASAGGVLLNAGAQGVNAGVSGQKRAQDAQIHMRPAKKQATLGPNTGASNASTASNTSLGNTGGNMNQHTQSQLSQHQSIAGQNTAQGAAQTPGQGTANGNGTATGTANGGLSFGDGPLFPGMDDSEQLQSDSFGFTDFFSKS